MGSIPGTTTPDAPRRLPHPGRLPDRRDAHPATAARPCAISCDHRQPTAR